MASSSTSAGSPPSSDSSSEGEEDDVQCVNDEYAISTTLFVEVLQGLKEESIIVNSSRGTELLGRADAMSGDAEATQRFSSYATERIQSFLVAKNGKLRLARVWRTFHLFRISSTTLKLWNECVSMCHLAEDRCSEMLLQIVLRRMMEKVIKQLTSATQSSEPQLSLDLSMKDFF